MSFGIKYINNDYIKISSEINLGLLNEYFGRILSHLIMYVG